MSFNTTPLLTLPKSAWRMFSVPTTYTSVYNITILHLSVFAPVTHLSSNPQPFTGTGCSVLYLVHLKFHLYSRVDAHTDSCGHHGRVIVLFVLPSGVCLEDALHTCTVDRRLQEHSIVTARTGADRSVRTQIAGTRTSTHSLRAHPLMMKFTSHGPSRTHGRFTGTKLICQQYWQIGLHLLGRHCLQPHSSAVSTVYLSFFHPFLLHPPMVLSAPQNTQHAVFLTTRSGLQ